MQLICKIELRKLLDFNLKSIFSYVQWSLHNPKDGVYDWNGIANVESFIEIASELGLYIILRPGPYICAEIDNVKVNYLIESAF